MIILELQLMKLIDNFIEACKNASAKYEEFKSTLCDIHDFNKKLCSNKLKSRKSQNKGSSNAKETVKKMKVLKKSLKNSKNVEKYLQKKFYSCKNII